MSRHRHHEFLLRIIDTSVSWINLVERSFGLTTGDAIRRRVARSELRTAIETYLEQHNAEPKPFVRTAPSRRYPRESCQEGDRR